MLSLPHSGHILISGSSSRRENLGHFRHGRSPIPTGALPWPGRATRGATTGRRPCRSRRVNGLLREQVLAVALDEPNGNAVLDPFRTPLTEEAECAF